MAIAFTDNEKMIIKEKLHDVAVQCIRRYGMRKTTVEQLTKMSGISKGSFYLFYNSKEILFFEILESFQKRIFEELVNKLNKDNMPKKQVFIDAIFQLYQSVKDSFILTIIQNNDIEYLFRKLPPELITRHHSFDDMLTVKLFEALQIEEEKKVEVFSAALRALFMTMLHEEEIGVHYIEGLKMLINGLADQITEGDVNDNN